MTASLPSMKIGRTLKNCRASRTLWNTVAVTSMLNTAVSGAEALKTWILPAEPTLTGAEKVRRSGASAHTLAACPGKRLMIVTSEGVPATVPPEPPLLAPPGAVPALAPASPPLPVTAEPPCAPPALLLGELLLEHELTSAAHDQSATR